MPYNVVAYEKEAGHMFRGCSSLYIGVALAGGILLGCIMPTAFLLFIVCCVTLWLGIVVLFFH